MLLAVISPGVSLGVCQPTSDGGGTQGGYRETNIMSFKELELDVGPLDFQADDGFLEAMLSFTVSVPMADVWQVCPPMHIRTSVPHNRTSPIPHGKRLAVSPSHAHPYLISVHHPYLMTDFWQVRPPMHISTFVPHIRTSSGPHGRCHAGAPQPHRSRLGTWRCLANPFAQWFASRATASLTLIWKWTVSG